MNSDEKNVQKKLAQMNSVSGIRACARPASAKIHAGRSC